MRVVLIGILFLITSFSLCAQTFTFSDSVFQVNSKKTIYTIKFELNKATIKPESFHILDSIVFFLNKHQSIVLKVKCHTDSGSANTEKYMSRRLTQSRSIKVADYIVSKGIAANRLVSVGMNAVEPLVDDREIAKLKSKDEIEKAHAKNRRIELEIIKI